MRSHFFFIICRLACSRRNNNLIISTILTALSFLPLVVALQVTQTMAQGIIKRYLETSSYHFKVIPARRLSTMENIQAMQQLIKTLPGVKNVLIEENNFGIAFSAAGREGVLLRGLREDFRTQDEGMKTYLNFVPGSSEELQRGHVFIGEFLAKKLKLNLDDRIRILMVSSENMIPSIRSLTVRGIFSVGYHELDKGWIFLNKNESRLFENGEHSRMFLGVKVVEPFVNRFHQGQSIQALLPDNWFVTDWYTMNARSIDNFRVTTLMLFFVFGLMVCVGISMNASSLYIFFLSRRKDIALLKALGLPPHRVRNMFMIFGFLVGVAGILGGTVLGSLITMNIHRILKYWHGFEYIWNVIVLRKSVSTIEQESFYLHQFIPQFKPFILLCTGIFVLLWSTGINFFPSSKIAKMKVLTILRKL